MLKPHASHLRQAAPIKADETCARVGLNPPGCGVRLPPKLSDLLKVGHRSGCLGDDARQAGHSTIWEGVGRPLRNGCTPDGLPSASMTITFDFHFAQRSAGRATLGGPLMQAPVPVRWAFQSLLLWMVRTAGLEPALLCGKPISKSGPTLETHRRPANYAAGSTCPLYFFQVEKGRWPSTVRYTGKGLTSYKYP